MSLIESEVVEELLYEHHRFTVDPNQEPLRIDRFLMDRLKNASRSKIQAAVRNDFILVYGEPVKPNYKVQPGDIITVSLPEPPRDDIVVPENIPIDIVYEDEELIIVNKPAGMVVHPAYQNWTGTLVNALAWHFRQLPVLPNNEGRPGLVHRIDKDTSGLLVVAKTEDAIVHLANQFMKHSIERTYYALVWGEPDPQKGTINKNLGRSEADRRVTVVYEERDTGKRAVTHFETLKNLRYVSLVKCNLETGRTHQIRAHMKYIGHPLFNDSVYGGDKILKGMAFSKYKQFVENCFKILPRQALHAKSIGFIHPGTQKYIQFDSDLPADFSGVVEKWEKYLNYQ